MKAPRERRSVCPVACTLDVLGDRWTLLVVRDLFAGKTTFKQLADSPERIATNILADRLAMLAQHELIERLPTSPAGGRAEYRLTSKGQSLMRILKPVAEWGLEHIDGTTQRVKVPQRR